MVYKHKSSFYRHTKNCKWITNGLQMDDASNIQYTCSCGKSYKYRQGLYKHKQKCKVNSENLVSLLKNSQVIQDKMIDTINNIVPQIGNNNNNTNQQLILTCF